MAPMTSQPGQPAKKGRMSEGAGNRMFCMLRPSGAGLEACRDASQWSPDDSQRLSRPASSCVPSSLTLDGYVTRPAEGA